MKPSTISSFLLITLTTALPSPNPDTTPAPLLAATPGAHGDGFYIATINNGKEVFEFQPVGSNSTGASVGIVPRDARDGLNGDESVHCLAGGNVNLPDIQAATQGMARQLGPGALHIANKAFFYSGNAVAYCCSYASGGIDPTDEQYTRDLRAVQLDCGSQTALGYVRDPHAAYGVTFNGDHFC